MNVIGCYSRKNSKMLEKYYSKEDVIKWVIECDIYLHVKKAMKHYGIEATEETIKRVYITMPKLKKEMLRVYKEIINGKEMPSMPE